MQKFCRLIWPYRNLKNLNWHQIHVEIVGLEDSHFDKSQKGWFSKKIENFPQISLVNCKLAILSRIMIKICTNLVYADLPYSLPKLTVHTPSTNWPHIPDLTSRLSNLPNLLTSLPDLPFLLPQFTDHAPPTYRPYSPDLTTSRSLPKPTDFTSPTYRPYFSNLPTSFSQLTDLTPPMY